jgi:hypothetical protein
MLPQVAFAAYAKEWPMPDEQATNGKQVDPMESWRQLRDTYLDSWSKAMIEAVNSDAYAQASGVMLDTYLSASTPIREAAEKTMLQALQQLSMPSRADFISLADRLSNVEMRLDDMDAKLDRIEKALSGPTAPVRKKVARPRRKRAK